MSSGDRNTSETTSRRLIAGSSVIVLLLVALLLVVFLRDDDPGEIAPPLTSAPVEPSSTNAKLDTRSEVVARLREILKIRDQAFQNRDPGMLVNHYTVDCPCLEGDKNAIRELSENHYHVEGGATSIEVKRVEQVNNRLWLVVADFRSASLRIEAEDGRLIREEPAGSDLFQFALSKSAGSGDWLLGQATAYRDG
jgi:hypothetical protein